MKGDEILLAEADLMALVGQGVANVELLRRRIAAKDAYITELESKLGPPLDGAPVPVLP